MLVGTMSVFTATYVEMVVRNVGMLWNMLSFLCTLPASAFIQPSLHLLDLKFLVTLASTTNDYIHSQLHHVFATVLSSQPSAVSIWQYEAEEHRGL